MSSTVIILLVIAVIAFIAGVIGVTVLYMNAKQLNDENKKLKQENRFLKDRVEDLMECCEEFQAILMNEELIK